VHDIAVNSAKVAARNTTFVADHRAKSLYLAEMPKSADRNEKKLLTHELAG
jgi:hypothetical protein